MSRIGSENDPAFIHLFHLEKENYSGGVSSIRPRDFSFRHHIPDPVDINEIGPSKETPQDSFHTGPSLFSFQTMTN
jgi:hypothetical protein